MGLSWIKMAYQYFYKSGYYVRGLHNPSLSCSINALLQSFSATPELLDILTRWHLPVEDELDNVPLQLKNTLLAMKESKHHFPHKDFLMCLHHHFIHRMHLTRFAVHDADEIFHSILNLTQKQMTDKDLAEDVRKLYEIKMDTQVMCKECTYIQNTPNSLYSLPLAIHRGDNTLESCIQSFTQKQTLKYGEGCYCDRCMMKRPSTHQLKLVSLPAVLCIHLKRFRNDDGYTTKLYDKVTFPETLHMESENDKEDYALYAVIVHIGRALFGHYTAYIRHTQDDGWFHADDSFVHQATWKDVKGTYQGRSTAYLLLYRKMSKGASG